MMLPSRTFFCVGLDETIASRMLANTFHSTLTQYISLTLKLSGWPYTVEEVKEDFSTYPAVDTNARVSSHSSYSP